MQRRLRVCRLLPPRKCLGAHSSRSTLLPARRAVMAAHNAALPPPNTKTSYIREVSIGFPVRDWQDRDRTCVDRRERDRTVLPAYARQPSMRRGRSRPGATSVFGAGRYFLALFSDQLRSAASVFSTCLVGFRLM